MLRQFVLGYWLAYFPSGSASIRHCADYFFYFGDVYHHYGIPGATVQEASVRALAYTLLASNAQDCIDLDAPKRIIIFVGHPEHAVFHRAILHACGRTGTAGAALGDDSKFFWFFLARSGDPFGARLVLLLVRHHPGGFRCFTLGGHGPRVSSWSPSFYHTCTEQGSFTVPAGIRCFR